MISSILEFIAIGAVSFSIAYSISKLIQKQKSVISYNSLLAKIVLHFSSCTTIMLFGFIFTVRKSLSNTTKNHEKIHIAQYFDIMASGFGLVVPICIYSSLSLWFLLLPLVLFYIMYLVEFFISFIHNYFAHRKKDVAKASDTGYDTSSFEMEAYKNQSNMNYLNERKYLQNFKYYGTI